MQSGDAPGELLVAQHALEFGQQGVARKAQDSSGERKPEEFVGLAAPEQARDRDVGIKNGPHARARCDSARGPLLPCRRSPAFRPR